MICYDALYFRSVILFACRLDSISLFDHYVPGADSPITNIVALLMTAYYLKDQIKKSDLKAKDFDRNVLFVLFNGESADYIGSQRMFYDMKKGIFPTQHKQVLFKLKSEAFII